MSAGWVLVQTSAGAASQVVDSLATIPGVERAERIVGAYDVVARVADAGPQVRSAKRVAQAALQVPGVTLAVCCHEGGGRSQHGSIDLAGNGERVENALEPSR